MIELSNITKRFGENEVLSGISLSLPEGSVTALIGPSGGGKRRGDTMEEEIRE